MLNVLPLFQVERPVQRVAEGELNVLPLEAPDMAPLVPVGEVKVLFRKDPLFTLPVLPAIATLWLLLKIACALLLAEGLVHPVPPLLPANVPPLALCAGSMRDILPVAGSRKWFVTKS